MLTYKHAYKRTILYVRTYIHTHTLHGYIPTSECFKYLGYTLTNDGRYSCKIKSRIAMAKAAFNIKKALFTIILGFNLRKNLVKC